MAGSDPGLVAAYLSAEHGIGVRDGRFCAHPLLARLGVPDGRAAGQLRAWAPRLEDVDRLLAGLDAFLSAGPQVGYAQVAGRWQPVDDPRPTDLAAAARGAGCGPARHR